MHTNIVDLFDAVLLQQGFATQKTVNGRGFSSVRGAVGAPEQDENAVTSYEYNPDDTTASVMDARGSIATFSYNSRRLLTHIAYQPSAGVDDTPDASFTYDAAGNRLSMTDGMGSVAYVYDQLSRLSSETRSFTSLGSFPLGYQYNLAGKLKKLTDPTNASIDYTHDAVGRTIAVTGSTFGGVTQYATNVQYRAWGAVRSASFGQNTHTVSASYNARLQPTHFEIPGVMAKDYQYQADGRLRYSADQLSNKFDRSYSYDHAGRIKEAFSGPLARGEADTNDRPYKEFNQYDAMDHLVGRVGSRHWSHALPNAGVTDSFVNNRNPNWQYDADGRLTDGSDIQSTFDAAGRTTSVVSSAGNQTQTRLYDGDGQESKLVEVSTQDDGGGPYTTTTVRYSVSSSVVGEVITELDQSGNKARTFVYNGSEVLAWQQKFGSVEQVSWEYRDPSNASYRMATANGNTDSDRAAEMDPLGSNAGTQNPYTQGHQHWPAEDGIHPGFADLTNPDCQVHGMPTPCTSLNYELWGSKIASLPGFGTNWGSFTELGLREYEQRKTETLAAYALAQRPRPRLRRAKKRSKKEIDKERQRNAGVGKDEKEPQNSYDPRADFRDYGRQLLNNGVDNDCLKLALLVYKAGQIWGDQVAGGIIDGLLSQLTEITSTTYGRRNASDPNFRVGVEGPGRTFGYSGFKREFQDQESPNQVRHFIAYLALGYTEPVRLGADAIAYLRDPNNQPDRDLGYVGNRLGNEFKGDYERLAQDIWYEVCGQSTSGLNLK